MPAIVARSTPMQRAFVAALTVLSLSLPSFAGGRELGPPLPSLAPPAPLAGVDNAPAHTSVWITGDMLFEPQLVRAARPIGEAEGLARMLAPLSRVVHEDGDDLGAFIVNLETPVATLRREPDAIDGDAFRARTGHRRVPVALDAPRSVLTGLVRAGVTAVSMANNHALDQTRDGLGETLDAARHAGLATIGAGRSREEAEAPLVVGRDGARIAVLATFLRDNPEPALPAGTPQLSTVDARTVDAIHRARPSADVVVVVVHVVAELDERPSPALRALATALAAEHVDAVIVHGPHVVAPVERIGSTVVAWSIGNLLSDMGHRASPSAHHLDDGDKRETPRTRAGLVARIEARTGDTPRVSFLPIWADTDRFLVDHGLLPAPVQYAVRPLRACGSPFDLPRTWSEATRDEASAWLGERRDALLRTSHLPVGAQCEVPVMLGVPDDAVR